MTTLEMQNTAELAESRRRLAELDPVDRFLKEMGVNTIEAEPVLKVTAGSLPEQTQVVLLDYQR